MHLVKTFIQKLSLSHIMGRTINRETPFSLVLIGLIFLQQIQGDQGGKTIIRGDGKDYVLKLWIRDDIGDDIDTPDDFERLKHRESEAL